MAYTRPYGATPLAYTNNYMPAYTALGITQSSNTPPAIATVLGGGVTLVGRTATFAYIGAKQSIQMSTSGVALITAWSGGGSWYSVSFGGGSAASGVLRVFYNAGDVFDVYVGQGGPNVNAGASSSGGATFIYKNGVLLMALAGGCGGGGAANGKGADTTSPAGTGLGGTGGGGPGAGGGINGVGYSNGSGNLGGGQNPGGVNLTLSALSANTAYGGGAENTSGASPGSGGYTGGNATLSGTSYCPNGVMYSGVTGTANTNTLPGNATSALYQAGVGVGSGSTSGGSGLAVIQF